MLGLILDHRAPSPGQSKLGVDLSVVTPVFNEEDNINNTVSVLESVLQSINISYEIIAVDDGSTDESMSKLRDLAQQKPHLKLISLSRNFGHQIALTAGLEASSGKAVVCIDSDLQDPPELISQLFEKWKEGYDVVYGVQRKRAGESFLKKLTAKIYYRLLQKTTSVKVHLDSADFRLFSRRAVQAILAMPEHRRYLRGMSSWIGFKQASVYYDRQGRTKGSSKFSYPKMIRFAVDGLTSFSYIPLHLSIYLGFLLTAISVILALCAVSSLFISDMVVKGWNWPVIVILFVGGIELIVLGILGEYMGYSVDGAKKRPLYVVQETVNIE